MPERKAPPVRLVPPALKDLLARRVPLVLPVLPDPWVLPALLAPKVRRVKRVPLAPLEQLGQLVLPEPRVRLVQPEQRDQQEQPALPDLRVPLVLKAQ